MISSLWLLSEQRVPCSGPRRLLPLCERAVHLALAVIGLGTVFLPYAAAQVAESTPPPSGFVNAADTGQSSSSPKRPAVVLTPEMRGDIYMAEKKFREAAEVYRDNSKGSAVMLNKTGIAYHQMLQLNVAERYYRLALHTDPKYSEAVNNLGTIYYAKKSYRRAINQYKKALRMHPDTASVWSNLAMGYFSRGDEVHAQEAFQMALKLDPDVFENRSTQGVLLQERSVTERGKFHYYLAHTYAQAGRNDLALQYIRKALEEGFTDRKKFLQDPEFASLRELPEFKELLKLEPRVL